MLLKNLIIHREEYGQDKGTYRARVEFMNDYTHQSIILPAETSLRLLDLVGDLLIEAGENLAKSIKPAIETATNRTLLPPGGEWMVKEDILKLEMTINEIKSINSTIENFNDIFMKQITDLENIVWRLQEVVADNQIVE
jgi:hypothetical protein